MRLPRKLKKKKKQKIADALEAVSRACSNAALAMYAYQQWASAVNARLFLKQVKEV